MTEIDFSQYNEEQVRLMEEECILVDENDNVIGHDSKKNCHLNVNIDKGLLHRAFSVFLFDDQGRLLLQQRADEKITFPGFFTNTCCSHPLFRADEMETGDHIGVRRAAQRKLEQELGIPASEVPLEDFHFLTRIYYKARSCETWGEHEIDYIFFISKPVTVTPNPIEVKSFRYVSQQELRDFLVDADSKGLPVTPWFRLIVNNFLYSWWDQLKSLPTAGREVLHRL